MEILDIVDKNDKIIYQKEREEYHANFDYMHSIGNYFRGINVFIKNSENKLWIPRRAPGKRLSPLCLDSSCGGHVETGESYETSFAREVMEELNIDITKVSYKFMQKLNPIDHNVSCFMHTYEIQQDQAPAYNPSDFIEYYWLTPEELVSILENKKDSSKSDLCNIVKSLYR